MAHWSGPDWYCLLRFLISSRIQYLTNYQTDALKSNGSCHLLKWNNLIHLWQPKLLWENSWKLGSTLDLGTNHLWAPDIWRQHDKLLCLFLLLSHLLSLHLDSLEWILYMKVKVKVEPCPILCNPMDYSLPSSSDLGILQARILEYGAIPFLNPVYSVFSINIFRKNE